MENQRNLILAVVLAGVILIGWEFGVDYFYPTRPGALEEAQEATNSGDGQIDTELSRSTEAAARPLEEALSSGVRIPIRGKRVLGSIRLAGARIDDLTLTDYDETLVEDSAPVRLFAPENTPNQHFAQFTWIGDGVETPGRNTAWTTEDTALTPDSPVTLRWTNGTGQRFTVRYSIDENYLITAQQGFANSSNGSVAIQPVGVVKRTDANADASTFNVHTGPIGMVGDSANYDWDYDDVAEEQGGLVTFNGNVGWLGFTDIYWLSALVPADPTAARDATGIFRSLGSDLFQSELRGEKTIVGAGETLSTKTFLFAGGKETNLLENYEAKYNIPKFDRAIDWGWFYWFEKPIFYLLHWLFLQIGNFGVAIILLTVIIRGLMFPIAQKQFGSMAQMRAVQPKMKKLQERYKDDKQKMQQEVMALYKKEKVNPLAGCLPIFLQIPIFFALYKVLRLTIEMRHQPFTLWIKDLSAPDPLTPINLFGILPFDPPSFLAIGILPIILGITMWLQFRLNPAPMDPVQQQVFSIMPWILMFVMAPFAAGLQLYWAVSNTLTIAQQKWLYSRHPQLKEQMAKDAEEKARKREKEAQEKAEK